MAHSEAHAPGDEGGLLATLDRVVWQVERAFAFLSSAFIFGLMMVGVVQIVSRKIFNAPIFGYIDLVELAMTTFAFLAISYTERLGGHVRMELVLSQMRGRILWAAEIIGVAVALCVITVLIYYGWTHTVRAFESGDTTIDARYPWWPSKLLVPIAFSLLWIRLVLMGWGYIRLFVDPRKQPVGVPVIADIRRQAEAEAGVSSGPEPQAGHL